MRNEEINIQILLNETLRISKHLQLWVWLNVLLLWNFSELWEEVVTFDLGWYVLGGK